MTISRWCAQTETTRLEIYSPSFVEGEPGTTEYVDATGHQLCRMEWWSGHTEEHRDCCWSKDETEARDCTCHCHGEDL